MLDFNHVFFYLYCTQRCSQTPQHPSPPPLWAGDPAGTRQVDHRLIYGATKRCYPIFSSFLDIYFWQRSPAASTRGPLCTTRAVQCPCPHPQLLIFCQTSSEAIQKKPYRKPSSLFQPFFFFFSLLSPFSPLSPNLLAPSLEVCKAGLPFSHSSQAVCIYLHVCGYFYLLVLLVIMFSHLHRSSKSL